MECFLHPVSLAYLLLLCLSPFCPRTVKGPVFIQVSQSTYESNQDYMSSLQELTHHKTFYCVVSLCSFNA